MLAAFSAPAAGAWGTARRDSITGPDQFTLNGAMSRTFRLRNPFNLDVRIDATNLLNHGVIHLVEYGRQQHDVWAAGGGKSHAQLAADGTAEVLTMQRLKQSSLHACCLRR